MATKKPESAADLLASLQSSGTAIGALDDMDRVVEGYPTGNIVLDNLTGVMGFPKGRIVQQYGVKSSGKTTSALQAMALEQRTCIATGSGYVMFFDYEKTLDTVYCQKLGIDTGHKSFIYYAPETFEEGANLYRKFLATGEVRIAIFDSVAAMITEKEASDETGSVTVADRAKMMHQLCRQITPVLARTGSTAVFLNHQLDKVDTSFFGKQMAARGIKQKTQPGGEALPFYSSLMLEYKPIGFLKVKMFNPLTGQKEDIVAQTRVKVTVTKNKVGGKHMAEGELRVRYGRGFSQAHAVLSVLVGNGAVDRAKTGIHTFPGDLTQSGAEEKFRSEEKAVSAMEDDLEWLERLTAAAQSILDEYASQDDTRETSDVDELIDVDAVLDEVGEDE